MDLIIIVGKVVGPYIFLNNLHINYIIGSKVLYVDHSIGFNMIFL